MKQHHCPVEKTVIDYEGECNWCGEKENSSPKTPLPSNKCMTCDCMYPCSDARSAERNSMSGRPYD
jgi:hypothetical protein